MISDRLEPLADMIKRQREKDLAQTSPIPADRVEGITSDIPTVSETEDTSIVATVKTLTPKDKIIQLIQSSGAALLEVQKMASIQNAMAMDLPVFKEMTVISKRLNEMMLEVSKLRGL